MSKNITISEGSQAKNFNNVAKIRTNVIGGGTQNWVPEDEAGMYANLGVAEIDKNGIYKASDENLDGFSQVAVSVQPKTKTKTITKNGTYKASKDKVDGYSEISVEVPTEGGGGDPTLITKDITENGSYNASDDNADGYSSVNVNVAGMVIQGTEMQATAINAISKGATVYIKKAVANPTQVTAPTGLSQNANVFYYNGYIYYNNGAKKVPYSNLTATPEDGGFTNGIPDISGYVVGTASNYQSRAISIATGTEVTHSGVGRNTFMKTANQKVSFANKIYDQSLNLLATLASAARGFPLPNNTMAYPAGTSITIFSSSSTSVPLSNGRTPSNVEGSAQVIDYRMFTYLIDADGNSTGDFGYIDLQGIETTGTATFVKLFDCYAGASPQNNIHVAINNDHTKVIVMDSQYGITILKSDGTHNTYSSLPHGAGIWAYLVGDYLFVNGQVYDISSEASMGITSSKNHDYLGICKNDVASGAVGTAIILFS